MYSYHCQRHLCIHCIYFFMSIYMKSFQRDMHLYKWKSTHIASSDSWDLLVEICPCSTHTMIISVSLTMPYNHICLATHPITMWWDLCIYSNIFNPYFHTFTSYDISYTILALHLHYILTCKTHYYIASTTQTNIHTYTHTFNYTHKYRHHTHHYCTYIHNQVYT